MMMVAGSSRDDGGDGDEEDDYDDVSPPLFDVGGRDCDSLYLCPFRPLISSSAGDCGADGRDFVRIYDGVDEFSPLIGTFCGLGDFPSSVVGTGRELFLQFHTAVEGAFLGTGFDLRVDQLPGGIEPYNQDKKSV